MGTDRHGVELLTRPEGGQQDPLGNSVSGSGDLQRGRESQKRNSMAPEKENHTRMTDLSELQKERMKKAHDGSKTPSLSRTSETVTSGRGYLSWPLLTSLHILAPRGGNWPQRGHRALTSLLLPTELQKLALTKAMEYFSGESGRAGEVLKVYRADLLVKAE
jgi:heme oxygenase